MIRGMEELGVVIWLLAHEEICKRRVHRTKEHIVNAISWNNGVWKGHAGNVDSAREYGN